MNHSSGNAADALEGPTEGEPTGGPGEQREDTFFLPKDVLGSENSKPGDILQFKVVGKTADGEIEVEHVPSKPEAQSMGDELRSELTSKPTQTA